MQVVEFHPSHSRASRRLKTEPYKLNLVKGATGSAGAGRPIAASRTRSSAESPPAVRRAFARDAARCGDDRAGCSPYECDLVARQSRLVLDESSQRLFEPAVRRL